ncbi:MAG: YdbL family protein [Candidatus Didemnitutus sp.]|nr:YdbL family protein [Candidatus Didemnitutus sp.]
MITRILFVCAALFALTAAAPVAQAQSAAELRNKMAQRLPQLDDLKAKGAIGENNRGFVEVRAAAPSADRVVSDENRDREAVYALIAKETGATPEAVGRARAKQIATQSRSGVWVQDESGAWKKK